MALVGVDGCTCVCARLCVVVTEIILIAAVAAAAGLKNKGLL